jgi:hypothetical protein
VGALLGMGTGFWGARLLGERRVLVLLLGTGARLMGMGAILARLLLMGLGVVGMGFLLGRGIDSFDLIVCFDERGE